MPLSQHNHGTFSDDPQQVPPNVREAVFANTQ